MVNHYLPKNLAEALRILCEHDCYIMAGGTDLMMQKHVSTSLAPNFDKDILYVSNLKELDYIKNDNEGNIHIGAATKYHEIENSELVRPIYRNVVREIASPNIRNMATLAGNIANASPAGDSLVPLVIDDALKGGDKVSLVGFGTLSINERAARKGRNPQTKKEMMIPAKKVVKFKAGADLANL